MRTPWGENIDIENILPEYPRPQMERTANKPQRCWEYAITDTEEFPTASTGKSSSVFAWSELSGVNALSSPSQTLCTVDRSGCEDFNRGRILLHFVRRPEEP